MPAHPSTVTVDNSSPADLDRLRPIAAAHPAARRYSQARRNLLPRQPQFTALHGRWAHERLAESHASVDTVLWCPGPAPAADLVRVAAGVASTAKAAYTISERTLARIHPGLRAPEVLSVVAVPTWRPADVFGPRTRLVLVADGIEYAGNLGALIRTADAGGADALVLTSVDARLSHPKVFVASRGTLLTMPVVEYSDVADARRDLATAGFTAYIADPAGQRSYRDVDYAAGRTALVVGSEGDGVCAAWRTPDLERVSIPMLGRADSLNVAASAAILLFEARARLGAVS